MTGTLSAPLARALELNVECTSNGPWFDMYHLMRDLRSDSAVLAALAEALAAVALYHAEWMPRMRDEVDRKWLQDHETAIALGVLLGGDE